MSKRNGIVNGAIIEHLKDVNHKNSLSAFINDSFVQMMVACSGKRAWYQLFVSEKSGYLVEKNDML